MTADKPRQAMGEPEIGPCAFCGHVTQDVRDALHPTGIGWQETPNGRIFTSRHNLQRYLERDGDTWQMACLEHEGGCGVTMTADSKEEVIAKWNRRPGTKPARDSK
jgi:hypothetical protein